MPQPKFKPSFIEEARRKQIVEAAIQAIAEKGYINTSLSSVAEQVNISKGVISYHFNGKSDLIDTVIDAILERQHEYIAARVGLFESPRDQLRAYITANIDFMDSHRSYMLAQVDLWGSFTSIEAKKRFNVSAYDGCREFLNTILQAGQEQGEFRIFDTWLMASLVQAAIDGVLLQWVFDEDAIHPKQAGAELVEMFDAHTRSPGHANP
jgi:TetR/AcrR family transcriptional regulator, fatty acid metabolism regulator protein